MKTLTRYIGREVLASIVLIFAALVLLFAFFDLINELGDVGRDGYTTSAAVLFVALQLPSRMYELFPIAALIGTSVGNQITLPTTDMAPAVGRRTSVRPKGQSAKLAMRNDAIPNGIVMIRMHATTPATAYPRASQKPARTSQRMLPIVRTLPA